MSFGSDDEKEDKTEAEQPSPPQTKGQLASEASEGQEPKGRERQESEGGLFGGFTSMSAGLMGGKHHPSCS